MCKIKHKSNIKIFFEDRDHFIENNFKKFIKINLKLNKCRRIIGKKKRRGNAK